MSGELKDGYDWVPITPAKTAQGCSAVDWGKRRDVRDRIVGNFSASDACFANVSGDSGCNASLGLNVGISDKVDFEVTRKVEVPPERIREFQPNDEQAHHTFGSDSTTSKASDAASNPKTEKLASCGVSLNKEKRPKMKKHRPRVFDEFKPRKAPKSQTVDLLTPKQKTPRRAIPRTSPPEKRRCTRRENPSKVFGANLGNASKSCRQKLDFNCENRATDQHGQDSCGVIDVVIDAKVMETYAKDEHVQMVDGFQLSTNSSSAHAGAVDQTSYSAVTGFTVSLNTCPESSLRDSLEDTSKLDFNVNSEVQDFKSFPLIFYRYQRRNKTKSNPLFKEDLNFEEKIRTPEDGGLKLYEKILRPNECLKNSRKLGPNFPRMFKKKRMKQQRATVFPKNMYPRISIRHEVTSTKRSKYHRSVKKIKKWRSSPELTDRTRRKSVTVNKMSPNITIKESNLKVIQPSQTQISAAMEDPKSFTCVWSLCPMAYFRKKRSPTRSRKTKFRGMHKEMKSCDLTSSCLLPTAFPLKAISVVTQDTAQENVEDCADISVKQIPHLDPRSLIETPIFVSQHLDLRHMFSNVNAHEAQGVVDFISQRLERLCMSDVNNQLVVRDKKISGEMIPYKGKFDPSKRRKLQPKVYLDAETLRVWSLLMEADRSEDIGNVDDETKEYWDSARELFRGRMDSFISCMHRIQGDRRFSLWKGSVVDSVIGVFLTQNVSDHLSSSAFMSLAAKFPPSVTKQSNSNKNDVGHQEPVYSNEIALYQASDRNNEKPCFGSTEQSSCDRSITEVKYGDTAPGISDLSTYKSSINSSENSSIFRQDLLVEEDTFLHQYYCREDNTKLCYKSIGIFNFEVSQSNTCALRSYETPNLDFNSASCLTKSQNNVADLGNININGLPKVGKNRESTRGINKRQVKERQESPINWDDLRKRYSCGKSKDPMNCNIDSANWEAVRQASVQEIAKVIMDRGMNNILAGRIKDFLDRMIEDHGTIDLEWLRDVPSDEAKNYLLSIPGLGLKSTECVRLLTLRHHAFPVDTNIGRILVRLGWVPLLPLPEDVQIHLLNNYPLVDTIQKYIWPRLCKISRETLYECHYQMITFGKVFCTKRQPNCNACPMRGHCRHFASAYASAKLRLPGGQGGSNEYEPQVKSSQNVMDTNPSLLVHCDDDGSRVGNIYFNSEPTVEFPPSPEPASRKMAEPDIEDLGLESEDEIPTIKLNQEEFTRNLQDFMEKTNFLSGEGKMSKELVVVSPEAASIPMPQLKFMGRLRTVHQVYEVPDSHPLLAGFEKREPDDPCPYLLAIWINEETVNSSLPPKGACSCQQSITCDVGNCCLRDEVQKQNELIQGTILIPCRTANRGSFPLNGTYFQVNEVFADHESSRQPVTVPRKLIWNLRRRSLYCGTSTTSIFRGMTTDEIQYCFWRGFICVRATDRATRAPRPLARRFHICKSRRVGDE